MLAITHGRLLTVTQGTIEDGTPLIDNGRITAIGKDIAIPQGSAGHRRFRQMGDAGPIDAHTHISTFNEPHWMPHIGDGNEVTSPVTAQIRGIDALNPFDMAIGAARSAGFTTCYTGPGAQRDRRHRLELQAEAGGDRSGNRNRRFGNDEMALGENPKRRYGSEKKMPMTRMAPAPYCARPCSRPKQYSDDLAKGRTSSATSIWKRSSFRLCAGKCAVGFTATAPTTSSRRSGSRRNSASTTRSSTARKVIKSWIS